MNKIHRVEKINLSVIKGYTETSFGVYTYDEKCPRHFDGNCIVIENDNDEVYETLRKYKFAQIKAYKEWFEKNNLTYDTEEYFVMKSTPKNGEKYFKGCEIKELSADLFEEYYANLRHRQEDIFGEFFKVPTLSIFDNKLLKVYLIYKDGNIIGGFEVNAGEVFEDVYIKEEYRRRGIVRNYLNYISGENTMYLVCGSDVVDFYKKSGFEVLEEMPVYSKMIIDTDFDI